MLKKAIVVDISEDFAILQVKRECACTKENCKSMCFSFAKNELDVKIKNDMFLKKGDIVELEGDNKKILFYAFCSFVVPIVLTLISYFVANKALMLQNSEKLTVFFVVIAFIIFCVILFKVLNKIASKDKYYIIKRIIKNAE